MEDMTVSRLRSSITLMLVASKHKTYVEYVLLCSGFKVLKLLHSVLDIYFDYYYDSKRIFWPNTGGGKSSDGGIFCELYYSFFR